MSLNERRNVAVLSLESAWGLVFRVVAELAHRADALISVLVEVVREMRVIRCVDCITHVGELARLPRVFVVLVLDFLLLLDQVLYRVLVDKL